MRLIGQFGITLLQLLAELWVLRHRRRRLAQPGQDGRGRGGRRHDAPLGGHLDIQAQFLEGGHIRRETAARNTGMRQNAGIFRVGGRGAEVQAADIHLARQQRRAHRRITGIDNIGDPGAGQRHEQHQLQMIIRAHAGAGKGQRIGVGPGAGDDISHAAQRALGMHRHGRGVGHQAGNGGEIGQLELRHALDGDGQQPGHIGGAQSQPIRPGAGHRGQRHLTAGAGAVGHHEGHAQHPLHGGAIASGVQVGAAAGGEAYQDFYWAFRAPGLGQGRGGQEGW